MDTSRIKLLAKEQGKSITYICKLVGKTSCYLNDLNRKANAKMPDAELRIIATDLSTTPEYLLGLTEDRYPKSDNLANIDSTLLTDPELLCMVSDYLSLSEVERESIRVLIHSLANRKS